MRSAEGWLTNLQVCLTAPLLWRGFFFVINVLEAAMHLQAARARPVANQDPRGPDTPPIGPIGKKNNFCERPGGAAHSKKAFFDARSYSAGNSIMSSAFSVTASAPHDSHANV